MKKILLATQKISHTGTGVPSYNMELIRGMHHGYEISLLTESGSECPAECARCFSTEGHTISDYQYCRRLTEAINAADYDCIISSASNFIPVLAPFLKAPIVSVSHFVNGLLAKKAAYNAGYKSRIIVLSDYAAEWMATRLRGKDAAKIETVYNFVDHSDLEPVDKTDRRGSLKIVCPSANSMDKSIDVVQKTLYRLLASDLDFRFYWIGRDTPLPADKYSLLGLKKLGDFFKKDPRLKITGLLPLEEARRMLWDADIFLLPSRGEGCPMTLLEAMGGGCIPVVSDARHGSREIIERSGAGLIVAQGDDKRLYEAIRDIILHRERYTDCYEKSRKYLEDHLSWEQWLSRMEKIIGAAMGDTKKTEELTPGAFRRSLRGMLRIKRYERLREMARNGWYRILMEGAYVKSKAGGYR